MLIGFFENYSYETIYAKKKVKVVFIYAVSSPLILDHSKRFTLFALPGRPVHSDTNSASLGSILLRATTKSLTFPPLSIARSFIQLSQLHGASMERTKMPNLRNGSKVGFEPGLT